MVEILILCGIYLVELVCYQLGLRILFEVKQKTRGWMLAGLVFPVIIGVLPLDASGKNVLVSLCVIAVTFFTIEGNLWERCVRLALIFLLLICIEEIFSYFFKEIMILNKKYIMNVIYLEEKCWAAIGILLLNILKLKIIKNKRVHIDSIVYLILGVISFSMMFSLGALNYIKPFLENSRFKAFCNILDIVTHISMFLLIVFVVYIKNTHERMEQLLKTEQLMKESQVNYYKQLLKKESDTRKYRHDMINHLIYVQDILSKDKNMDARRYISSILGGFEKIQNTYYVSGNEMVDTIMNYYFGMLPSNVEVSIKGKSLINIDIEETDVCTIFSNVFQNAVEEIVRNSMVDAKIIIEIRKGKQYVQYCIRNSLFREIKENEISKNGFPKSRKFDKRNHGIGMVNTKSAIERNFGKFEWYQKDGYFCVSIILPIKI